MIYETLGIETLEMPVTRDRRDRLVIVEKPDVALANALAKFEREQRFLFDSAHHL